MTTPEERERLRGLAEKATPGPWGLCNDGTCSCKSIDAEHHPIARVIHGDWGDDYPTIELTGPSIDLTARAVMKQITYGNIPEAVATINGQYIVAAANLAPALVEDVERLEAEVAALREAANELLVACERADADGDLSAWIDGELMSNLHKLLDEPAPPEASDDLG